MRKIITTTIAIAFLASVAAAQSQGQGNAPVDWSGPYAGLKITNVTGVDQDYYFNGGFNGTRNLDGRFFGGFLGYNFQKQSFVYGGEIAFSKGEVNRFDGGRPDNQHNSLLDIKLRAGRAFGKALVYGAVGYSRTNWQENVRGDVDTSGVSYGVGIDYAFRPNLFGGIEYVHRELESDVFPWSPTGEYFKSSMDSVELRIGMKF